MGFTAVVLVGGTGRSQAAKTLSCRAGTIFGDLPAHFPLGTW